MTPELETYFDNYNELFNSRRFQTTRYKSLSNNATTVSRHSNSKRSVEELLYFRKGQVAAFATVINLQGTIEAAQ